MLFREIPGICYEGRTKYIQAVREQNSEIWMSVLIVQYVSMYSACKN